MSLKLLLSDLRTVAALARPHRRGASHAGRLEAFYARQSATYDSFRKRLLHGREELLGMITPPQGGRLLDIGGGTGSNIEALGAKREGLSLIEIVDLCPSLLRVARERIAHHGWSNVRAVDGDATTYAPGEELFDTVLFSYSLTMIPDWFRAIDNAWKLLKPGGEIAVVDFYVSRKWPEEGKRKHSFLTRTVLPAWFSYSNVFLSSEHQPYLAEKFPSHFSKEKSGKLPYGLGIRVPYYLFIGTK